MRWVADTGLRLFSGVGRYRMPNRAALGAIFFLLAALWAHAGAAEGSPQIWTLQRIVVANGFNNFASIVNEHYDASGGAVDIAADGRSLDLCSGGHERLHFDWHFDQDVTRISDGGALSAGLQGGIAGLKEPCVGYIAAISFIAIAGSAGITAPLSDEDMKVMDVDRFFTKASGDAWAGRDPKTGLGSVGLTTRPPAEG